jgi:hypothetical protein
MLLFQELKWRRGEGESTRVPKAKACHHHSRLQNVSAPKLQRTPRTIAPDSRHLTLHLGTCI